MSLLLLLVGSAVGIEFHLVVTRGSSQITKTTANSSVILVNGQFPAPTLEAVSGEEVVVHVQNNLDVGTSVHFHGLLQRETPHMDGVQFGTQCLIASNSNFTYRFKADAPGTFFYHSHVDVQFVAGFFGAFVVRASANESRETELVLLLSDWYETPADVLMRKLALPPFATPTPDAVLINGRGGELASTLPVRSNTPYRVRLINAGAISLFRVSVPGVTLTVVEADAHPVQPFETSTIDIDAGQRYVFTVGALDADVNVDVEMLHRAGPRGRAVLSAAPGLARPDTKKRQHAGHGGHTPSASDEPVFERKLQAAESVTLPAATKRLNFTVQRVAGDWRINGLAMNHAPMTPLLHAVLSGDATPADVQLVHVNVGDVLEITWKNQRDSAGVAEHHPMHIHGHRFWLLGSGTSGEPRYNVADETRPLLRDTFHLPHDDGWAITRFVADNPGVWLLHCHYAWHMTSGMALYIVYPRAALPALPAGTARCPVDLSQRATRSPADPHAGHNNSNAVGTKLDMLLLLLLLLLLVEL